MLVSSRTQETHKHDIPSINTIFLIICDGIYDFCGYWVDSTATQTRYSISKHHFLAFYNGIYVLCGYWLDSTLTQTLYSISKNHFVSVLQWNIRFVWVLSQTQQSHKHDISFQNTIFLAFCHGIYDLCWYWDYSTATKTRYPITKHHAFSVLRWNIRIVWVLGRLSTYTNTIFICKTLFCFTIESTICVGIESD